MVRVELVLRVFNHDKKVTLVHDVERKRGKVRRRLGRCNLARREQHRGRHDGHCRGIAAPVYGALTRLMRTSRSAGKKIHSYMANEAGDFWWV
jgi:hypothetical protein